MEKLKLCKKKARNGEGEWTSAFSGDSKVKAELRKLTSSPGWVAASRKIVTSVKSQASSGSSTPSNVSGKSSRKSKKKKKSKKKEEKKKFKMVLEKDEEFEVDYVSPEDDENTEDSDSEFKPISEMSDDDLSLEEDDDDDMSSIDGSIQFEDDYSDLEMDEDAPRLELPESSKDLLIPHNLVLRALGVYETIRHFRSLLRLSPMLFEDFCAAFVDEDTNVLMTECYISVLKSIVREEDAAGTQFGPPDQKDSRDSAFSFLDNITWPEVVRGYLDSMREHDEALEVVKNPKFPRVSAEDKLLVLKTLTDIYLASNKIRDKLMTDGVIQYDDHCRSCHKLGDLLCCETCPAVYHLACCDPPLTDVPEDEWQCEICVAHKLNGVYNCEPKQEFKSQYLRHEPLGVDRHGRKYWFLVRRLIVEGNDGVWYYSTREQFDLVRSLLDPDKYEIVLSEALKHATDDFYKYSEITYNITAESLPNDQTAMYLRSLKNRVHREREEKKKKAEEDRKRQELEEKEKRKKEEAEKLKVIKEEEEKEKGLQKQEEKMEIAQTVEPTPNPEPSKDAQTSENKTEAPQQAERPTQSQTSVPAVVNDVGSEEQKPDIMEVKSEPKAIIKPTMDIPTPVTATPQPITKPVPAQSMANSVTVTPQPVTTPVLQQSVASSVTASSQPVAKPIPVQNSVTVTKPVPVQTTPNSVAVTTQPATKPIPVPSVAVPVVNSNANVVIKSQAPKAVITSGAAAPAKNIQVIKLASANIPFKGTAGGGNSQLKTLFVLNKDGTKTQITLGTSGKINPQIPGQPGANRQILVFNSAKVSIPKLSNKDVKKAENTVVVSKPVAATPNKQSSANKENALSQLKQMSQQLPPMQPIRPPPQIEKRILTHEEEAKLHFKLGEDKGYKQYCNHYTENNLALNKYQHKEERDRERYLSYKFSLSDAGEFKWMGQTLGTESVMLDTLRNTLLHLEHQIPLCFMHSKWSRYRNAWGKIVLSCNTPQAFAAALGILEMATRVVVKRSIWRNSHGLPRLKRVTTAEKEDWDKKRKHRTRAEEEESNRNAIWCKYPFPIKCTLVWKVRGEEYRMTGYGGWMWISNTRTSKYNPVTPKSYTKIHADPKDDLDKEEPKPELMEFSPLKKPILPGMSDAESDSEKSASTTSTTTTKSVDLIEEPGVYESLVQEASEQSQPDSIVSSPQPIVTSQSDITNLPSVVKSEPMDVTSQGNETEPSVTSSLSFQDACDEIINAHDVINISENLLRRTPLYNKKWAASKVDILLGWRMVQRDGSLGVIAEDKKPLVPTDPVEKQEAETTKTEVENAKKNASTNQNAVTNSNDSSTITNGPVPMETKDTDGSIGKQTTSSSGQADSKTDKEVESKCENSVDKPPDANTPNEKIDTNTGNCQSPVKSDEKSQPNDLKDNNKSTDAISVEESTSQNAQVNSSEENQSSEKDSLVVASEEDTPSELSASNDVSSVKTETVEVTNHLNSAPADSDKADISKPSLSNESMATDAMVSEKADSSESTNHIPDEVMPSEKDGKSESLLDIVPKKTDSPVEDTIGQDSGEQTAPSVAPAVNNVESEPSSPGNDSIVKGLNNTEDPKTTSAVTESTESVDQSQTGVTPSENAVTLSGSDRARISDKETSKTAASSQQDDQSETSATNHDTSAIADMEVDVSTTESTSPKQNGPAINGSETSTVSKTTVIPAVDVSSNTHADNVDVVSMQDSMNVSDTVTETTKTIISDGVQSLTVEKTCTTTVTKTTTVTTTISTSKPIVTSEVVSKPFVSDRPEIVVTLPRIEFKQGKATVASVQKRTKVSRMSRARRLFYKLNAAPVVETQKVWKLQRYRKTSATLKKEKAMKLPLPWKFCVGKQKTRSIFRLPSHVIRRLAISGGQWAYRAGFTFGAKWFSGLEQFWMYPCPRPTFSLTWRYKLQNVTNYASVAFLLRVFWHVIKWDKMTLKPQTDDVVHTVTTDEEIITTELLKRKDNMATGLHSEYFIRKITMPILDPEEEVLRAIKPAEGYTPSRKGLRNRRSLTLRDRPRKHSEPRVQTIWVPEEQVELWQIRQFDTMLKQQSKNIATNQVKVPTGQTGSILQSGANTFIATPSGGILPTLQNLKSAKSENDAGGGAYSIVKLPLNQNVSKAYGSSPTAQGFLGNKTIIGRSPPVQKFIVQSPSQQFTPYKADRTSAIIRSANSSAAQYIVQGGKLVKPIFIKPGSQMVTTTTQAASRFGDQAFKYPQSTSTPTKSSPVIPKAQSSVSQTQIKLSSGQLSQLLSAGSATPVKVSVSIGNGKTGIGQIQLIPTGSQVTPTSGQQLMQAKVGGEIRRFLFTLMSESPAPVAPSPAPASSSPINEHSLRTASLSQRLQQIQRQQLLGRNQNTDMKRLMTDKDPLWGSKPQIPDKPSFAAPSMNRNSISTLDMERPKKRPLSKLQREEGQRQTVVAQVMKSILDRIDKKEEMEARKKKKEEALLRQRERQEQLKVHSRQTQFLHKHRDLLKQEILKRKSIVEKYLTQAVKNELQEDQRKRRNGGNYGGAAKKKKYQGAMNSILNGNVAKKATAKKQATKRPLVSVEPPPQEIKKQKMINTSQAKTKEEELYCTCKTPYDPTRFYIGCDLCLNWFHGSCVGIPETRAKHMSEWICYECQKAKEEPAQELYCICRTPYDDSKFYIGCDICQDWYHGSCVGVSEGDAENIEFYACPNCKNQSQSAASQQNRLTRKDIAELTKVINSLRAHKMSWPFLRPVSKAEVPNYYNVIQKPMDLGTILDKMPSYQMLSEMMGDVSLIFDNCRMFNGADSALAKCAEILESLFVGKMRQYRLKRKSL